MFHGGAGWAEEVRRRSVGAKERKLHPKILFAIFLGCEPIKTEWLFLPMFGMVSLWLYVFTGGDP